MANIQAIAIADDLLCRLRLGEIPKIGIDEIRDAIKRAGLVDRDFDWAPQVCRAVVERAR